MNFGGSSVRSFHFFSFHCYVTSMLQVNLITIFAVEQYGNANILIVTFTNKNINPLNDLLKKQRYHELKEN